MSPQSDRHRLRANGGHRVAISPMPPTTSLPNSRRVRRCFLSDIHLGFPGCRADYLLDFLNELDCETLYLVGDIVDFWSLKRRIYWPKAHHDVVRALLETLGNHTYALILRLNRYVDGVRRRLGYPYWSVAAFLKHKVGNAVRYIADFERVMAFEARRRGMDGLICGHIHRAAIAHIDGITYCNDGRLSLLRWIGKLELLGESGERPRVRRRLQASLAA